MTRTDRTADPAAATSDAMNWYVIGRGNSCPWRLNASAVARLMPDEETAARVLAGNATRVYNLKDG